MKRGSALLVVLGMLSFMVISAVAFSAFMRYSRLPSSYLRRTSSSRHLVKAALAEAIDIVDAAIADNPHPGVGSGAISYPRLAGGNVINRNYWRNHVFTGTNQLVAAEDTVSTLTLEGLAYLPPVLINEARFYSRHSTAGSWHPFGYDCGRFAFCAVDVSDHLNVNKVPADIARGSSPENRFSLAYMFEDSSHKDYTIKPPEWDNFMTKYVSFDAAKNPKVPAQKGSSSSASTSSSTLPFVSLADLNLAVNADGAFRDHFPFLNLTKTDWGVDPSPTSLQRRMAFLADGYYPSAAGASESDDYDLADDSYQPFTGDNLKENNAKVIKTIMDKSSPGAVRMRNAISALGLVHLWDYLDEDNVPVSLAIPSVERIPMVCGIKPTFNSSIKIDYSMEDADGNKLSADQLLQDGCSGADKKGPPGGPTDTRNVTYVKRYTINKGQFTSGIFGGSVKVVVAYPFRRGIDLRNPDGFTIDGHVELFLSTDNFKFRTANQNDVLHLENEEAMGASTYKGDGVLHVPLTSQDCTFNNVTDEDSAVNDGFTLMMGSAASAIGSALDANPILKVTMVQAQKAVPTGSESRPYEWARADEKDTTREVLCGMPPIGADGKIDDDFSTPTKLRDFVSGEKEKQLSLRMAVWLRIKNDKGKTVDLVPACLLDDKNFKVCANNYNSMGPVGNVNLGQPYPVMQFKCGADFTFKESILASLNVPVGIDSANGPGGNGVICADPRWNWAPEHWFDPGAEVSKASWLANCGKGVDGRDRDIFMATSDAGYMQSVYELAFLPRLCGDFKPEHELWGSMEQIDDSRAVWATSMGGCRNSGLMWRTYRPFARSGIERDNFEGLSDGFSFVSDGGAIKLNPYSDNENILMAAFANTPESWWAASANTEGAFGIPAGERTATAFNSKYAFSKMNAKAKFDWEDLLRIAASFKSEMQEQTTVNGWMGGYNELWALDGDDENRLMGVDLQGDTDDLYDVDRKFLYGYWRDSFAVKQQLFLIFVRAEPMMMGGGAIGQTPPQLGARAVALVWRNPHRGSKAYTDVGEDGNDASSAPANAPHQTKVLFYRQFD